MRAERDCGGRGAGKKGEGKENGENFFSTLRTKKRRSKLSFNLDGLGSMNGWRR